MKNKMKKRKDEKLEGEEGRQKNQKENQEIVFLSWWSRDLRCFMGEAHTILNVLRILWNPVWM